ncbi:MULTISPECIES: helix-turn-helix domain-containing protein [Kordiimonas]|jgi:excisionase family DNA binding protein|uniref:helix-turn-helix domain-containing protein n=1 Tax=Kordiimonas TaxID=288021 RepID=UPI00257E6FCB|nr:helix-turn-helix domain-containing protein [Kordiimonas sp. UBA4487]
MPIKPPQNGENDTVVGDMLTTQDAAQYLGLAPATLNKWRVYRTGPGFLKLGRAVRYRRADLDDYLSSNTHLPAL